MKTTNTTHYYVDGGHMGEREITLRALRQHLDEESSFWAGRTTDCAYEDDTHLTAWAWVERPNDVELGGAAVEVMHVAHTGGEWVEVVS